MKDIFRFMLFRLIYFWIWRISINPVSGTGASQTTQHFRWPQHDSDIKSGSAMASNIWGRIMIGTNKSYKIFLTPVSEFMSEVDGVIVRDTVMGTTDLTKWQ